MTTMTMTAERGGTTMAANDDDSGGDKLVTTQEKSDELRDSDSCGNYFCITIILKYFLTGEDHRITFSSSDDILHIRKSSRVSLSPSRSQRATRGRNRTRVCGGIATSVATDRCGEKIKRSKSFPAKT